MSEILSDVLRRTLKKRGLAQKDFAEIVGVSPSLISDILAERKNLSARMALDFEAATGIPAEEWMELEARRLIKREQEKAGDETSLRARAYDFAPVREMQRRGWIAKGISGQDLVKELTSFFRVNSLEEQPNLVANARRSDTGVRLSKSQQAWCFRARQMAQMQDVAEYKPQNMEILLAKLISLAWSARAVEKVPELLAEAGIRLAVVAHLKGTKIDGAAFWLNPQCPVIAISMRYDRIDYFWFTLLHELAHIFHRDGFSVADMADEEAKHHMIEDRANSTAAGWMVSSDKIYSLARRKGEAMQRSDVINFSKLHGIHPGIVVGQLQSRKLIPFSHHREFLAKVRSPFMNHVLADGF